MVEKERKLTPAEEKRKANFERICEEMEQSGYQKIDLTIDVLQANIKGIIIILPFVIVTVGIYRIINPSASVGLSFDERIVLVIAVLFLTVLHEAIHGLTWVLFAKKHFRAISFGVMWKELTPYCNCNEPLSKRQYITGVAMPTLILWLGLAGVAIAFGSFFFLALCIVMIFVGCADFFIIFKILSYKPQNKEVLYYDHPYRIGVIVFEKL